MNALIVEKMNPYLNQLNNLLTYATNVESGNPISNDDRENIGKTVFSFLASYDSGISYKDGLKYAGDQAGDGGRGGGDAGAAARGGGDEGVRAGVSV